MGKLDRLILRDHDPDEPVTRLAYERLRWAMVVSVLTLLACIAFQMYVTSALARHNCVAFQKERRNTARAYLVLADSAVDDNAVSTAQRLITLSRLVEPVECRGAGR